MDFSLSDEQQMLLDTTRRFIAKDYTFAHREQIRASRAGWSREAWLQLAELGLLGLIIPEANGGIGAGPVEAMLASNAVGEGLLLEPFHASAILATQAILELGNEEQRGHYLPALAAGTSIAALVHGEGRDRIDPMDVQTCATPHGNGWRLNGTKQAIYYGDIADLLLVSAAIEGRHELAVFALPADTKGITRRAWRTVDGQHAADIELKDVAVDAASRLGNDAAQGLQAALDFGLMALCGEALGALDKILAATIEYSRTRKQFGLPIGSFQALQHRMADMLMRVEQARSMEYLAVCRCRDQDVSARQAALSAAKVVTGQAARFVGQQAIQLHGGMGMTDELAVSHYFKRLTAFEQRSGSTDWHLRNYALQMTV